MNTRILIPKHLARRFNKSEIDVDASDLRGALETISRDYQLDGILLNTAGQLQPYIRVAVDEELVNSTDLGRVSVAGRTVRYHDRLRGRIT